MKNDEKLLEKSLQTVIQETERLITTSGKLFNDNIIDRTNFDDMTACIKYIFVYYNVRYYNIKAKEIVDNRI